ncbi:MAG: response regulator transcription factor [Cellvibrionaceae bacterium]
MSQLSYFCQHTAELLPAVDEPSFPQKLIKSLGQLVPMDDAIIVAFPSNRLPSIHYNKPLDNGKTSIEQFVKAAFLLDPYYISGCQGAEGFFQLKDLAPKGFKESEYYRNYYNQAGYQDECGYLIRVDDKSFFNISLARTSKPVAFNKKQLQLLSDITPFISALCQQYWRKLEDKGASPERLDSDDSSLRNRMHRALTDFGSSLLTEREAQVINLVLHGYQTAMIAEKFSISVETVKLHRKHAYSKLEIKSQSELFYLFLDSLMSAENYSGGDTLEAYLKVPQPK